MKRILRFFKPTAFLILLCLLLASFTSCPNSKIDNNTPQAEQVKITVQGDDNLLIGKGVSFSADKGTKWGTVKKNPAITGLVFDYGSEMQGWKLGDSSGEDLKNDYVFNENKTVFPVMKSLYTKVKYAELEPYIEKLNPAGEDEVSCIEVTDIQPAMLKGDRDSNKASPLGEILKKYPEKKVILKLPETVSGLSDMSYCFFRCESITGISRIPNGVTDMEGCFIYCKNFTKAPIMPESVVNISGCFAGCESLVQVPMIAPKAKDMEGCFLNCSSMEKAPAVPNSVTNMNSCFRRCTSLKEVKSISENVENMEGCFFECISLESAPVIPSSVTNMIDCFNSCSDLKGVTLNCKYIRQKFLDTFKDCPELRKGSIKVKAENLSRYKDNAAVMGTTADKFAAQ